jgi:hypothetical protein
MTKDYLGRALEVDDYVIFMEQHYRRMKLAKIYAFTASGKARIRWADYDWATLLQEGSQLVKVEGPDLTYFLLNQK